MPPVAISAGADHEPSGSRAMTTPEPADPVQTKPALATREIARPFARCSTAFGIEFSADSGWFGSAKKDRSVLAARSHCRSELRFNHLGLAQSSKLAVHRIREDPAHLLLERKARRELLAALANGSRRLSAESCRLASDLVRNLLELLQESHGLCVCKHEGERRRQPE